MNLKTNEGEAETILRLREWQRQAEEKPAPAPIGTGLVVG